MTTRRYASLPPETFLSPAIVKLDAEARALAVRRQAAVTERNRLDDGNYVQAAVDSDRQAAAVAIRAGKSPHSVGQPAMDKLLQDRAELDVEAEALATALASVEDEMDVEFGKLHTSPKTSGMTAAKTARDKYARAITQLAAARKEYYATAVVAAFLRAAASSDALPEEATDDEGWPVANPPWLRTLAARTDAHKLNWHRTSSLSNPSLSFSKYVTHLGIRTADARLTGDQVCDLFTTDLEGN